MRAEIIMSRDVVRCAPTDSLEHAASLMWNHDCGCLPVCTDNDPGQLVGIITDRDICMAALFQTLALKQLQVEVAMSRHVMSCTPHDSLLEIERKMCAEQIRRLPVVDEAGMLLGVVSMADLAREAARQDNLPHHELTGGEVCLTLAAICMPVVRPLAA